MPKRKQPERLRSGAVYKGNVTSGQYRHFRRSEKNGNKNSGLSVGYYGTSNFLGSQDRHALVLTLPTTWI
ncbi:hypothetical protein [Rhizobium phaseoli]|uniref:hypothetical protein n=1 Tax=Rhizobium phaseoli TaxID=396 RepID=UPI0011429A06|nr:hypothetical protein [Rhizobium phaseoli]